MFVVETGGFSSRETAQKVITAFNQLSGMQVLLEDIKISSRSNDARKDIGHRIL